MIAAFKSPADLSSYINSRRDNFFRFLATRIEKSPHSVLWIFGLYSILCTLFAGMFYAALTYVWLPLEAKGNVIPLTYVSSPTIIITSLIFAFLWRCFPKPGKAPYMIAAFVTILILFNSIATLTSGRLTTHTSAYNIIGAYLVLFLTLLLVRRQSFNVQFLALFASSIGVMLGFALITSSGTIIDGVWANQANRIVILFSVFAAERVSRTQTFQTWSEKLAYFFHPAYLFTPLPLRSEQINNSDDIFSVLKGSYDVCLCALAMIATLALEKRFINSYFDYATHGVLEIGFFKYLTYYLRSFAWIGFPVAICRLFGMKMEDYFDKPLLAVSPFERWRKWNTYYYQWFYSFIFFPLLKKKYPVFISVMAVFYVTMIIHLGASTINLFVPSRESLIDVFLIKAFIFFSLHGLAVYLSLKLSRFWPNAKSAAGWLGFLMTHIIMLFIHIFAP